MKFPVFDLHCDTALGLHHKHKNLWSNDGHISLEKARELDGYAQFFAFFCSFAKDEAPKLFDEAYQNFQQELLINCNKAVLCDTKTEAAAALDSGRTAAFVSIEGAEALACDPGRLELARERKIRMVGLTWNFENALGGSCQTGGGLTEQGREFVRRAQSLGILVDMSHFSEKGFWDVCDITQGPVIASHSNSAAIWPHARNLTDEQFRAICQTGGVAGINLYADFLGEDVTFETVYQHIDHWLQLGGEKHIALGGDLDGCERLPQGFTHVGDYNRLADYLLSRGIAEATLADIYYNNAAKVVDL